jgi:REP element-mobilizing transposase RayT
MPDPVAFFLTWTTYGTWLPGDDRGWVRKAEGIQQPNPVLKELAQDRMTGPPCTLDEVERKIVENTIAAHCEIRGWRLHAVNCRTNHVHVVVTAGRDPKDVRDQFKAWCTRKLKERQRARSEPIRENWWTERGSQRHIGDDEGLEAAIQYVLEGQ